jgi:hypothetical protein
VLSSVFYFGLDYNTDFEIAKNEVYKNICATCKVISVANDGKFTVEKFLSNILLKNATELLK